MSISYRYETQLFRILGDLKRLLATQPLVLGGYTGSGGGVGGRPGGFVGQLPQSRVTFDTEEAAASGIPYNYSGASLVTNLNRIRYRIEQLETSVSGGVIIKEDNVVVASGITVLDFQGYVTVEQETENVVRMIVSASGGYGNVPREEYNEDLSSQIDGAETTFTTTRNIYQDRINVFYNGLQQAPDKYSIGSNSVTLTFTPQSGDTLTADYEYLASGYLQGITSHGQLIDLEEDDHPQYLTSGRGYTQEAVNLLLDQKTGADIINAQGDLFVGSGYQSLTVLEKGTEGEVLVTSTGFPYSIGWKKKTINQQAVFSIEGSNLAPVDEGLKPLRVYVHDVGTTCYITEVLCAVNTSPASANLRVNVLKNGATIFSSPTYVEITTGNHTGVKTDSGINNGELTKNDYLQIQLVQGDTGASDLTVHIRFYWEI